MGCAQSRVDNEEAVARCKERRNVIKEAVTASKAFAAGHFAYAIALKNTGAALSDYGHGESDQTLDVLDQTHYHQQSHDRTVDPAPQPPPPPPIENLPPPPPPLPKFSPSPIKRAISLPTMAGRGRKLRSVDSMAIEEEDEEEEEEEEEEERVKEGRKEEEEQASPRTPENVGNGRKQRAETPDIVSASPGNNMAWDYFFMVENMPGPNLDDRGMGNGYETRNNNHFQFNGEEEEEVVEERSEIFRKISGHKAVEETDPKTPEKVEEVEEEEEEEEDEEEEEEEEEEEDAVGEAKKKKKGKAKIEHSNTAPADFRRAVAKTVKTTASSVNLMKILDEIDDRFLKASECAQEVSKMLEATRLHYHSNFADNQGIEFVSSSLFQSLTNAHPFD